MVVSKSLKGIFRRLNRRILYIADSVRDISLLTRTSCFFQEYYESQLERRFKSRFLAICHYTIRGAKAGVMPCPLYSGLWLAEQGSTFRNMADYLRQANTLDKLSPHPLFSPKIFRERNPGTSSSLGQLEGFMASVTNSTRLPYLPESLASGCLTFGELLTGERAANYSGNNSSYQISVIVDDISSVTRAMEVVYSIDRSTIELPYELVLIPATGRKDIFQLLKYLESAYPMISVYRRSPGESRGRVLNKAVELAQGSRLLFLHAGHRISAASIEKVSSILNSPEIRMVQPLVVDRTGLISSAGAVFPGIDPVPVPWLRGISPETAEMPDKFSVPAAQFPYILRKMDLPRGQVFNEESHVKWIDVDLALRMTAGLDGAINLLTTASVVRVMKSPHEPLPDQESLCSHYRTAWKNLIPSERMSSSSTPLRTQEFKENNFGIGVPELQMIKPEDLEFTESGFPRLRWSIKTSAPATLESDDPYKWGDTYFALSLREALIRLGQVVTVDCLENKNKASSHLDDVVLNIQGYETIVPVNNAVNVTWVISHPELVVREDLAHCQLAYAASDYWAEIKSKDWGFTISPLLQCTDQYIFNTSMAGDEQTSDVVFVGNAENRERNFIEKAAGMGLEMAIYGKGWSGRVPQRMIRGEHVANEDLCTLYGSARATLNDHWPEMREQGFLSNRAFDVVASGGKVISDLIASVPEKLLADMEIEFNLSSLLGSGPGVTPERVENPGTKLTSAEYVLTNHTFDVRARKILDDVKSILGS